MGRNDASRDTAPPSPPIPASSARSNDEGAQGASVAHGPCCGQRGSCGTLIASGSNERRAAPSGPPPTERNEREANHDVAGSGAHPNHIHNGWAENNPFNGDFNDIGHLRSEQTGKEISGSAGNRVPVKDCITDQGDWGPVSNGK